MKSLALKFYEHASIPEGGAIYVCRRDDPRISDALREAITVPCVVARDLAAIFDHRAERVARGISGPDSG